jgi:hypothetical protein
MIPFMLNRADQWLTPAARAEINLQLSIAETFRRNFWITTSGMFSSPSSCSYTKSSDPTGCSSQSTTPSAPTPKDAPSSTPSRSTRPIKKNSAIATRNAYYTRHPSRPHHHNPDLTNRNWFPAHHPVRALALVSHATRPASIPAFTSGHDRGSSSTAPIARSSRRLFTAVVV